MKKHFFTFIFLLFSLGITAQELIHNLYPTNGIEFHLLKFKKGEKLEVKTREKGSNSSYYHFYERNGMNYRLIKTKYNDLMQENNGYCLIPLCFLKQKSSINLLITHHEDDSIIKSNNNVKHLSKRGMGKDSILLYSKYSRINDTTIVGYHKSSKAVFVDITAYHLSKDLRIKAIFYGTIQIRTLEEDLDISLVDFAENQIFHYDQLNRLTKISNYYLNAGEKTLAFSQFFSYKGNRLITSSVKDEIAKETILWKDFRYY